jgi:hypothetical protein
MIRYGKVKVELDTPTGPRVTYNMLHDVKDVEAELPDGWEVSWSDEIRLWNMDLRAPLFRTEPTP